MMAQAAKPPAPPPETIREKFERVFGKPPHHRMKLETMREQLRAHDNAQ